MERKELMEKLFDATIAELLKKIADGTATPADLNVARQMLRDNGITAVPKNANVADLVAKLGPPADVDDEAPSYKFG